MNNKTCLFGPAGSSESFLKVHKSTVFAPMWLKNMGLNAFEYQCGRGVNTGVDTANKIGDAAREHGITLSLHSPYFINLSSSDSERMGKNNKYITDSCHAAMNMGAKRVIVHCGGLTGLEREVALGNHKTGLKGALAAMEAERIADVALCVETMGKKNTIGSVEEVALLCAADERLIPCIDFGHVNSREGGTLKRVEDYLALLDILENHLGSDRGRSLHVHFSRIEYSKGGEVRHRTFAETDFEPDYEPMLEALYKRSIAATIICESAGTQAEDALTMKEYYEAL